MMNGQKTIEIGFWLLVLTFVGTVLLPPVLVDASIPKIEISDITFGLLSIITLMLERDALIAVLSKYRWLFISLLGLMLIASVSIVFNGRITQYRDWFEPIKFFKLTALLSFVLVYMKGREIDKIVKFTFLTVLVFNLCHYFNLFNFNDSIEVFYAPAHHLDLFGLNSIGEPSTRRMLGTLGNPNNNALLFLLFVIYFLPKRESTLNANHVYMSIAAVFVLACQSRTGFITLIIILLAYFILHRINWKHILFYFGMIGGGYLLLQFSGNIYLGSLGDISLLDSAKRGRFEQWNLIFNEMPGKWFLGHGVNKSFFEQNEIYAESEYMLILYRYGVAGLLGFLAVWLAFFKKSFRHLKSKGGMMIFGVLLVMSIAGITNSPFHVVKLSVLIVFLLGIGLNLTDGKKS